jgi:hypothetical protein
MTYMYSGYFKSWYVSDDGFDWRKCAPPSHTFKNLK